MTPTMLRPVLTVPATALPLSVAEFRAHSRVDSVDNDELLERLIGAAVSYLDGYSGILRRAIINQTWKIEASAFCEMMRLPFGDIVSVVSVKYYDINNVQQTADTSLYGFFTDSRGPYIRLKTGQSWPATYQREDAVEINWVAGFGGSAAAVPEALRHGVSMLAAHFYEHREAVGVATTFEELPFGVRALIAPFRRAGV